MIAVVMVSFHTGPVLWRSIEAALAQPEVSELALVDNGNPPDTIARLRELAAAHPKLTLLSGHGNVGFAAGCNLGVSATTADTLLFLNPDAVLPPGGASALAQEGAASDEDLWAAGPKLIGPDGAEQRGSRRAILTPWNAFVEAARLNRLMPNHPSVKRFNEHEMAAGSATMSVPCLSGACFCVPRRAFEAIGGFDHAFFLHVEDIDFFLRLARAGGRMLFVPSVEVVHFKSSSRVDPLRIERLKRQSLNLYFASHFKGYYPPGFLSVLRAMLWTAFFARALRHNVGRFGRGLRLTARRGPRALLRARRLQRPRSVERL
ncbi:MAG: glycosyltransferase family 2 protein [Parvularcula sp.]|jgi:GT2 family glycosyltransferase|nr:glycosyltransferase family 2 protein [Parvularcula sp.]